MQLHSVNMDQWRKAFDIHGWTANNNERLTPSPLKNLNYPKEGTNTMLSFTNDVLNKTHFGSSSAFYFIYNN